MCCGVAQLATGWGVWKELGSRKADYNLRFATGGAQALQAALGPAEARDFKCIFSAALGDDWTHYLRTCAAGALLKLGPSEGTLVSFCVLSPYSELL